MKIKLFVCKLLLCIFLSVATFGLSAQTASITQGCPPLSVNFTPPSGIATYFWDFGNNVTSNLELPSTTYIEAGEYTVSFSAGPGQAVLGTITISVLPTPDLAIQIDTTFGCTPLTVNFSNTSTISSEIDVLGLSWGFGDGGSGSGLTEISHTYTAAGTFTPSLSLTTNQQGCDVTKNFPDLIQANTVENVGFITTPNVPTACDPPFQVAFNNTTPGSNLQFQWDFGNGQTANTPNPSALTYTDYGRFKVTLTATDELGCQNSFEEQVNVGKPRANFSIRDTFCIGDSIQLFNLSDPGEYRWDFGSNAVPLLSTEENPIVVFKEKGIYPIRLSVSDPSRGCQSDTTIQVFVDKPDATFTSDPSYTCSDSLLVNFNPAQLDADTYLWVFGDLASSTQKQPSHQYILTDTSTYGERGLNILYTTLFVQNVSGCRDTSFVADTLFTPNALFMPDKIDGCAPLTVNFADSSNSSEPILNWTYDYGDGSTAVLDTDELHSHVYTEAGTYDVVLRIENEAGCRDTSYALRIEVGDAITPDFTVDKTDICPGESVQFTTLNPPDSIDAWHFETDAGRSFHCFNEPDLNWVFKEEAGPMDVALTVEFNGCQTTTTKEDFITVRGPVARLDYEMDCASPLTYEFRDSSYDASVLSWDFGDGETSNSAHSNHTYTHTGDYQIILRAENPTSGCPASFDTTMIFVREIESNFQLGEEAVCQGASLVLDASPSQQVDTSCWKGRTWIFDISGRPITTQEDSVLFSFSIPGQETVTLVTEDINGCTDTMRQLIDILEIEADFEISDRSICFPSEIAFTSSTESDTSISSYEWQFGDGGSSSEANPFYTYTGGFADGDTIPITLQVKDALGCPSSASDFVVVYQPRSFIITDPPFANICLGEEVKFFGTPYNDAGSNLSFSWDFGNGHNGEGAATLSTYDTEGSYLARMTYQEVGSGCGGVDSVLVNVQAPPEALFTTSVDEDPFVCFPSQIQFTNTTATNTVLSHRWDFGNGQQSTDRNPLASFEKGTFEVELISSTTFGCSDTTYRSITLIGPEGDFDFNPEGICEGGSATFAIKDTLEVNSFSWDFGDGTPLQDDVSPITHTYNNIPVLGPRPVTLILRSAENGCVTTVTKPITIFETRADFLVNGSRDSVFCDDILTFTDNSTQANAYRWDFGNGMTTEQQNPEMSFAPGSYQVQLAVANTDIGCRDTLTKVITLTTLGDINFRQDTICLGDTTRLSILDPVPGFSYSWQASPDLLDDLSLPTPRVVAASTSSYQVTVTNEMGCSGEAEGFIYVITPPIWEGRDTSICVGETLDFADPPNPDGLYEFSWSPPLPRVIVAQDSVFRLTIGDVAGCFEEHYDYFIRSLTGEVKVPNVFTPNGDSFNDVFKAYTDLNVEAEEEIDILNMKVWNRWGQVVFEGSGPDAVWDGMHKGLPAPSDVYIYTIEMDVKVCDMRGIQVKRGDVTLVR